MNIGKQRKERQPTLEELVRSAMQGPPKEDWDYMKTEKPPKEDQEVSRRKG